MCSGFVSSLSVSAAAASVDGDAGGGELARVVTCLLHCLPLLHAGNAPAKAAYLHVLPPVLRRCTDTGRYLPDCQQLLSYALIHPAISGDELTPLSAWQPHLLLHNDVSLPPRPHSDQQVLAVNGPPPPPSITSAPPPDRVSNGGVAHRDLSAARSLPVGLQLHDFTSSSSSLSSSSSTLGVTGRPSRSGLQQSSPPPPGLVPRALTPPRLSQYQSLSLSLLCVKLLPSYKALTCTVYSGTFHGEISHKTLKILPRFFTSLIQTYTVLKPTNRVKPVSDERVQWWTKGCRDGPKLLQ